MPDYTDNYNLEKPTQTEFYNVDVQNGNMDKIDATMDELNTNLNTKVNKTVFDNTVGTIKKSVTDHEREKVSSEEGVHGFRYIEGILQIYDSGTDTWIDAEVSGGGIAPANVIAPSVKVGNGKLTVCWGDPGDTIVDSQTICTWKGTKLLQKVGAYPENIKDGIVVVDNQVINKYKTDGFEINNLTNGMTYYFALFPYSDKNAVNENVANRATGTPYPYEIYGVRIDTNNSNPETSVIYTDDAVGMVGGSFDWDTKFPFNQIRPCLLLNGVVQYYLNPNNFTQKENGSAANITSTTLGDVMIEIPKVAYMIYTEDNYLYIKITDNTDAKAIDSRFCYYGHTRTTEGDRDKLYVGAYLAYMTNQKLFSLSATTPYANEPIATYRTFAQGKGEGYDMISFYPLTLLQCLYTIRYKNLNSQIALGAGYTASTNTAVITTGGTNAKGMYYGEATGTLQMKFAGIEDFWGNLRCWVDGIYFDANYNILTAFTNFNDTGAGYTNQGKGASVNGYMTVPQGTSTIGFLGKTAGGSATTYFCSTASLSTSCVGTFGGGWSNASAAGAFFLMVSYATTYKNSLVGGRLMYL